MTEKDIEILNEIINHITFYVPFLTIIFGTLGSFCNVIIFTSKKLRYNSCAFYFLCSTIFDVIYLLFGGITRLMSDHYSNILPNKSILFCKFRIYLVVTIPSLSTYFLMLASIDRCLSTSTSKKWRNLSDINIAWRVSILTLIITLLLTCHILFLFELQINSNVYNCIPHAGIYTIFVTIFIFLSNPFIVYTIMFTCTIITLIRIKKLRCRMGFVHNRKRRKYHNIDRHLIIIMFIQIGLGMLLTFFRCGFLVYSLWTNKINKNILRITIELFLDKFSLVIYYINFAKSFPVNIITSPLFRQVFCQRMINFIRQICHFTKEEQSSINRITIKRQNQIEYSDGYL